MKDSFFDCGTQSLKNSWSRCFDKLPKSQLFQLLARLLVEGHNFWRKKVIVYTVQCLRGVMENRTPSYRNSIRDLQKPKQDLLHVSPPKARVTEYD